MEEASTSASATMTTQTIKEVGVTETAIEEEGDAAYKLAIAELRELFSLVAKDLSYISTHELAELMKTVGMPQTEDELKESIREVDVDGNGIIDFDEFVGVMTRKVNSVHGAETVKHAFAVFRQAEIPAGKVRVADIQNALMLYGTVKCTASEASQLVSTLGLAPTQLLDYIDFVNYLLK